jgi:hypothetical protein
MKSSTRTRHVIRGSIRVDVPTTMVGMIMDALGGIAESKLPSILVHCSLIDSIR